MGATIGRAPYPVNPVGAAAEPCPGWCARYRGPRAPREQACQHRTRGAEHKALFCREFVDTFQPTRCATCAGPS